jgi:cation diffusion facilitator family transporter
MRLSEDPGDRVTFLGILGSVLLMVAKLVAGFLTGSAALIADGVHSASDMATDIAVLGGMHLARRKADAEHPYGHGRYETLAGGLVAAVLILVGLLLAWEAIGDLRGGVSRFPGIPVIAIALVSILIKEWLYRWTFRVARAVDSAALHANAWHHRSDALSSVAVLFGGIGGLLGWGQADSVAGLIVGLMVAVAGARTLIHVFHELTEGGVTASEEEILEEAVQGVAGVRDWHRLRTRRVGRETFVDLHVLVDPALSIVDAHSISTDVEQSIRRRWRRPINVTVHVEPTDGGGG